MKFFNFRTVTDCTSTLAMLDDYTNRELKPSDIAIVEEHLKFCHACAEKFKFEVDFASELRERLDMMPSLEAVWDRMCQTLYSAQTTPNEKQRK